MKQIDSVRTYIQKLTGGYGELPKNGLRNRCSTPELRWRVDSIAESGDCAQLSG